jgi:hypothetical protein
MPQEWGYRVRCVLDRGGALLIQAESPEQLIVAEAEQDVAAPGGEREVWQQSFYDPSGCKALATGENMEETARAYLAMYSGVVGDPVDILFLPPGQPYHFELEGSGTGTPVWLTVQAAPPDGVQIDACATPPGHPGSPVSLLHERFADPEGFASLASGAGAEDVATGYARRYEGRFGKIAPPRDEPSTGAASRSAVALAPSAMPRWVWPLLAAFVLALLAGGFLLDRHAAERRAYDRHATIAGPVDRGREPLHPRNHEEERDHD